MKEAKTQLDSMLTQGRQKIKALESEVEDLTDMETDLHILVSKCGQQSQSMREAEAQASRAEDAVRVLDGACSRLLSQVQRMGIESEGMPNVVADGRLLRQALTRFVRTAIDWEQAYVRRICEPLARLLA